jgi:RNA polymerase sigma-70 factor (ECF subfamily)
MQNNTIITGQQEKDELIGRCKAGDRQALNLLYSHYKPYLLNICKYYAKEEDTAEDLLHDAFIVILTSLDKLRSTDKLEVWMTTIVRNIGYHYWKHIEKEHTALKQMADESQNMTMESTMPDFELMQKLVAQLPKGYQQVFRLSVFEGLSHQEISRMLNIAPHTSSSQLLHAKRMLQKLIKQSWLLILLFIAIPTVIWKFIHKERPDVEGNPKQTAQEELIATNRQQEALKKTIAEHSTSKPTYIRIPQNTTFSKPTPDQERLHVQTDTVIHDNKEQEDAKVLASQSTENESTIDTIIQHPILKSDMTKTDNADIQIKTKPSVWNIQIAYNGQLGKRDNSTQTTSINAKSFSAISNMLIPEETSYSNWNDYSFYLNNALPQQDLTAETRSLMNIATNNAQINGGRMEAHYEHQLPISIQLTLSRQLSRQLSVETGLSYTQLQSTNTTGGSTAFIQEQQHLHYLGIPLRMGWQWYGKSPLTLYTSTGVMMELPVHSTLNVNHVVNGTNTYHKQEKLSVPLQWSTSVGVGIQYDITPHIGFFVEPSLQYFFNDGSSIKSYRTEHRFSISLPLGIRFH